jgi:uncharacterized protein
MQQMHWDYAAIVIILGVLVPWRSRQRVEMLLHSCELTSRERVNLYLSTIAFQWTVSVVICWRCLAHGVDLSWLGLRLPILSRGILATAVLSALLVVNQIVGVKRLAGLPSEKRGLVAQLAERLLPRTLTDKCVGIGLVLTVAICEEFIYRGFIEWLFQSGLSSVLAGAVVSAGLFALAHLYQGRRGLISTFIVGLIFSATRIWTGSLIPSMIIHFATDFSAGIASFRLLEPAKP